MVLYNTTRSLKIITKLSDCLVLKVIGCVCAMQIIINITYPYL